MPYIEKLKNAETSYSTTNFTREGNEVLVSPNIDMGDLKANEWVRVGYFDPAEDISPTPNSTTEDRKAQDPNGGPDILLMQEVTEASAVFDSIAPLTPSNDIMALHAGAPARPVSGGITVVDFVIGANISSRLIVIKRRLTPDPKRIQKVYWFPHIGLQSNGTVEKQGRKVPQFRAPVLTWEGTLLDADIKEAISTFPLMGKIFNVPNDELDGFLVRLMEEAKATAAPDTEVTTPVEPPAEPTP